MNAFQQNGFQPDPAADDGEHDHSEPGHSDPADGGGAEANSFANARFTCNFGFLKQKTPWEDQREFSGRELAELLTTHKVGPKDGEAIVPATFRGTSRKKDDAAEIGVAMLDSDAGHTMDEIAAAVREHPWAAAIASTHSHLTNETEAKASDWERYQKEQGNGATAEGFLRDRKGYLERVAAGARVERTVDEYVVFSHQPCPKFRVALFLAQPWISGGPGDQKQANAAWERWIGALAHALRLQHDPSCVDTSRGFYLPRCPKDGPPPEKLIIEGTLCDIFALPLPDKDGRAGEKARRAGKGEEKPAGKGEVFTDPATGKTFDLTLWSRRHASRFEIVPALEARRPEVFTGKVVEGSKHHIRCVNEEAHTHAGEDSATFVTSASESPSKGFVYHCRHGHCTGLDRTFFLRKMLEAGWLKVEDLVGEDPLAGFDLTEDGVALAFVEKHGHELRFCNTSKQWFKWTGTHWAPDTTHAAFSWAREVCRNTALGENDGKRAVLGKAAAAAAVEKFAQRDQRVVVTGEYWDTDHMLLGTPGGTVDLRTGVLRPARQEDRITKVTAVAPAESAGEAPTWLRFLDEATGGDEELQEFLQHFAGYAATGDTREHKLVFIYGDGENGKSTFLRALADALGTHSATATMDVFMHSQHSQHSTDMAMLHGARMVWASETEDGRSWAETRIAQLTGGDEVTARFMRQDNFTFTPRFKLMFCGNHKPKLRNVNRAMKRRFVMVPFTCVPATVDTELPAKLNKELPGILRWMLDGCVAWQRSGLVVPAKVAEATEDYFKAEDVFGQWVEECCELDPNAFVGTKALFHSWSEYADETRTFVGDNKRFKAMMEKLPGVEHDEKWVVTEGFHGQRNRKRVKGFKGLRLQPPDEQPL